MRDIDSLLPRNSHAIVYRIIQEALTNVAKHSQAKNMSFGIAEDDSRVSLSVEDNGIGFNAKEALTRGPEEKGLDL